MPPFPRRAARAAALAIPNAVVTCHPRFVAHAAQEVRDAVGDVEVGRLDAGLLAVTPTSPSGCVAGAIWASAPVFVEHVNPVDACIRVDGTRDDLNRLAEAAGCLAVAVPGGKPTVAIECRRAPGSVSGRHADAAYTVRDVEVRAGMAAAGKGAAIDLAAPEVVIHVVLTGAVALLGRAEATASLRRWGDGMRRSPAVEICRSELKLLQAIEGFGVGLRAGGRVLDLGAAPGGWTYLLAAAGLHVDAVDPAQLDERVARHPSVVHLCQRAESLDLAARRYDLVVNDMALDPPGSAAIMRELAHVASPGAHAIMTLKLPTRNVAGWTSAAARSLAGSWDVVTARHLAANRQEITWLLRRSA